MIKTGSLAIGLLVAGSALALARPGTPGMSGYAHGGSIGGAKGKIGIAVFPRREPAAELRARRRRTPHKPRESQRRQEADSDYLHPAGAWKSALPAHCPAG